MSEWPLMAFTLLFQGAVGYWLMMLLCETPACRAGQRSLLTFPALFAVLFAGALGLAASTLHLGYPLNAFHALRHLSSSWLSREIVMAGLFLALAALCTLLALRKGRIPPALLWLVALAGLVDIGCMGAIYRYSSVATWMHVTTWVMFYGAVAVLGAAILLLRLDYRGECPVSVQRGLTLLIITTLLVRLLFQPLYQSFLSSAAVTVTFPLPALEVYSHLWPLRLLAWSLSAAGALLLIISLMRPRNALWLRAGAVLLIVAEVLLRQLFFIVEL